MTTSTTLGRALDRARRSNPEGIALMFEGVDYSWRWMTERGRELVERLEHAGLPDGTAVGLIPRNRPLFVATLLELLIAGRPVVMIYAFQSPQGIARDLASLHLPVVIADGQDWSGEADDAAREAGSAVILLDPQAPEPIAFAAGLERCGSGPFRPAAEPPGAELLTSGTTGAPKRLPMDYELIFRSMVGESTVLAPLDPDTPVMPAFMVYPFGNISGLYNFLPIAAAGLPTLMLEKFDLASWREFVTTYRPARIGLPPAGVQMVLDADIPPEDLRSIEAIHSGAARLDPHVHHEFEDRYRIPILLSYGATEFGGPVTNMTLEDVRQFGPAKFGSVGRAWAGAKLRVIDPVSFIELPPGQEGLLEVNTPRMGDRWIRTTDFAVLDEDGFMYHCGRSDGAISRGGFKILPEVVASAIQTHPAVSEVAVVGLPDRRLGQVPAAAIVLRPGAQRPSDAELERHARETLYTTHVPTRFLIVDALPRTPSLKVSTPGVVELFAIES